MGALVALECAARRRRRRGRPRKVRLVVPPTPDATHWSQIRDRTLDGDPIVVATTAGPLTRDALDLVVMDIAIECAALAFVRGKHEVDGTEGAAQASSRRVRGLATLAELIVESHHIFGPRFDVRSETVRRVYELFLETVLPIARATLGDEKFVAFEQMLRRGLDGWEDRI